MKRYVIQKRNWDNGKWMPVKVFLERQSAEEYMKSKNKQDYRLFEDFSWINQFKIERFI